MSNGPNLETFVRQAYAVNWVAGACMTTLLYNHLLTFSQEVARIWPGRFSLAKGLFFTNRYVVEALILFNCISASQPFRSPSFCVFYLRWLTIATTISTTTVQAILVLRIWALWRHSKCILALTYFVFFGGVTTLIGLVVKDYVGESVQIDHTLAALPGCYATSVPSIIAGFWIGPLIVETILFAIVISRAYVWWRDGTPTPRILTMLATDSTVYFAVIFAMLLANYLMFRYGPPFLSSLLVTPSTTAGCVLASQMFLRMRSMMEYDPEEVVMKAYNAWNVNNTASEHPTSRLNFQSNSRLNYDYNSRLSFHLDPRPNYDTNSHLNSHSDNTSYHSRSHRDRGSGNALVVSFPLPPRGASTSSTSRSPSGNSAKSTPRPRESPWGVKVQTETLVSIDDESELGASSAAGSARDKGKARSGQSLRAL